MFYALLAIYTTMESCSSAEFFILHVLRHKGAAGHLYWNDGE